MRERRNKEDLQRLDREARRRGTTNLSRSTNIRPIRSTLLIVCEGENTEISYFDQFKLPSATVEQYGGKGDPGNVVRYAQKLANKKKYDEVWCVFDKDNVPDNAFNNAIAEAEAFRFNVAWSNQSFEYWLILHFDNHMGAKMTRADYPDRINGYINPLGATYDSKGSKLITPTFFNILFSSDPVHKKSRIQLAVDRAGRMHGRCRREEIPPSKSESCTTVYKLAKRFLKYL